MNEYMTTAEICQRLGISRQNFHQSGLGRFLLYKSVGSGHHPARLYQREDVDRLARWLAKRQELINAGLRSRFSPLCPTREEWEETLKEANDG